MYEIEDKATIDSDLAAAIQELAMTAQRQKARRISLEELRAFLDGELTEDQEERLKDQMALDPQAARTLLELRDFRSDVNADSETIEAPVPEWQAMKRRLQADPPPAVKAVSSAPARWWFDPRVWQVAAAVLLLAVSGTFLQNLELRRQNRNLETQLTIQRSADRGPRLNVVQIDVLPIDQQLDRDDLPEPKVLPATEARHFLIALNISDPGDYSDHGIEIADTRQEDEVVWSATGLESSPLGTFNFELDRGFLAAGTYQIRLFGLQGVDRDLLAKYRIVVPPGG